MTTPESPTTGTRAYVASHFAVELNKTVLGFVRKCEGPTITSELLDFKHGSTMANTRQPGRLKYGELKVEVGMGLSPVFYEEIKKFIQRKGTPLNGAIIAGDFAYMTKARRTFSNSLISSVGFPGLDANAKDAAYLSATIVPGKVAYEPGKNEKIQCPESLRQPAKLWLTQNFRLTVDGFEDATARVTKVDPFEIKQTILKYETGHQRDPLLVAGRLEFPNVNFYIPEVDAQPYYDYVKARAQTYVDSAGAAGMTGKIEFLANDQTVLATMSLAGVDVLGVEPQGLGTQQDQLHLVKISISVESMDFTYSQDAVG